MMDLGRILIGPLVWVGAFSAVYGLHGVACAYGWAQIDIMGLSLLRLALVLAWIAAVLLQAAILAGLHSRRLDAASGFTRSVSLTTGWVGLVAAVWSFFPVAVISSCQ